MFFAWQNIIDCIIKLLIRENNHRCWMELNFAGYLIRRCKREIRNHRISYWQYYCVLRWEFEYSFSHYGERQCGQLWRKDKCWSYDYRNSGEDMFEMLEIFTEEVQQIQIMFCQRYSGWQEDYYITEEQGGHNRPCSWRYSSQACMKPLCKANCKGLCYCMRKNRNSIDCQCKAKKLIQGCKL
jgi:hypothetical protein